MFVSIGRQFQRTPAKVEILIIFLRQKKLDKKTKARHIVGLGLPSAAYAENRGIKGEQVGSKWPQNRLVHP